MFFRKQKTVGNDNRPQRSELTFIGTDCIIDGSIETVGELRIEGTVRGTVRAGTCVIAASGRVEGEVIADDVIVHGRVIGPLQASHVHLQSGAVVEGDISSDTIAIDTGARLSGAVWHAGQPEQPPASAGFSHGEPAALFSEALWQERQDDDYRPLRTVRPRAMNGSRN